jgi:hypothetical protein
MEIHSVADYLMKCLNNPLQEEEGMSVFYRGVNKIYPEETRYLPSLYYLGENFYKKEDDIFREVISIFPNEMLAQKWTIEKLILMQHYRFPTRILDLSKNPLVPLFFACFADKGSESSLKEDGVVYRFAVPTAEIKFCDSDTVAVIANICKRKWTFPGEDIAHLNKKQFNKSEQIKFLIHDIREDKPFFRPIIEPDHIRSVVCLRPRMNNPRIVRQDGHFFLFGIDGTKRKCAKLPTRWVKDPIFIPAKSKERILKELDMININEGFVYPEFEHVSNVIRKHYGGHLDYTN